jgi:3-phosphoshikimate 1-carboxyvinyltransferase
MSDITLEPIHSSFHCTITPPGSKSLTNRALVLAALAEGTSSLSNILLADDTQVMLEGLRRLGFELEVDENRREVRLAGAGGRVPAQSAELFCGNSGTTIRFLTALCALGRNTCRLDGNQRMRQRPIGELVDMLRNLGVRIRYREQQGYPPLEVIGGDLPGGLLRHGQTQSSQYLSAVLMVAPFARNEVRVDLDGPQTSWPYIAMTMQLMDRFHVTPELIRDPLTGEPRGIGIPQERYRAQEYTVEPDASNASYFLAAAAVHPGSKVTIEGLGKQSLQGDVGFADVLHRMGADLVFGRDFITLAGTDRLNGIDIDLADMPDTAQTLAAVALFASGPTRIRGLHTLRVKETDRIAALATELRKFGAQVEPTHDQLTITPPPQPKPAAVDTYDDHRMAMSFAVAGTRLPGVTIRGAECVNKTYPGFFDDLRRLENTQTARAPSREDSREG